MLRFRSPNKVRTYQVAEGGDNVKMVESQALEETEFVPNIIVSEVPVETLLGDNLIEESSVKESWLEAPTKMFISLLLKMHPNLGKTFDLKNKNKMLEQIQKALAEEGYNFSVKQVHTKYRTMERKYRLAKEQKTKTGRKRKPLPFERELSKLFGDDRSCAEYVLDSGEFELSSGMGEIVTPLQKKARCESNHLKILRKLDEIGKEKAQFHESMLERLKKKEQIEQERNELLKRIATSLENNFNSFIQAQVSNTEK